MTVTVTMKRECNGVSKREVKHIRKLQVLFSRRLVTAQSCEHFPPLPYYWETESNLLSNAGCALLIYRGHGLNSIKCRTLGVPEVYYGAVSPTQLLHMPFVGTAIIINLKHEKTRDQGILHKMLEKSDILNKKKLEKSEKLPLK